MNSFRRIVFKTSGRWQLADCGRKEVFAFLMPGPDVFNTIGDNQPLGVRRSMCWRRMDRPGRAPAKKKTPPEFLAGFPCLWTGAGASGLSLHDAFALGALASELAGPAHSFGALAGFLLGRLFKRLTRFHFPEQAFALHLLLQRAQGLLDVVIADDDLYYRTSPSGSGLAQRPEIEAGWA